MGTMHKNHSHFDLYRAQEGGIGNPSPHSPTETLI